MTSKKILALTRLGLPIEFPGNFFPRSAEAFRRTLAKGADAPDDFAVAHLLVAAATAIGRHVRAVVTPTWKLRPNLFLALIGFKGAGKSSLASAAFGPLLQHEESLAAQACEEMTAAEDREDDEENFCDDSWSGEEEEWGDTDDDDDDPPEPPPVIATDVTGPALAKLLELEPRQLLVHTDELAALFIRNTGGTDRQVFCELADGRRRRTYRATRGGLSKPIESPHVCLLGCLTPDLLKSGYSARGDDGFLDRFLLVGDGESRRASWPQDVHDPDLTDAWSRLIDRLLRIEADALDTVDGKLDVPVGAEATLLFTACVERLNLVADAVRMPESQRGVVNKMKGFLPKLALIRRCLRWASGEFGSDGPVGAIDAADAESACEAVAFLFGRWLMWRPELCAGLCSSGVLVGLQGEPGNDPALQDLARTASMTQIKVQTAERLIRYLRLNGGRAAFAGMQKAGPMATAKKEDLEEACSWLVEQGHATWIGGDGIQLTPLVAKKPLARRASIAHAPTY
jgi:hypothetical protein